MRRTLAYVLAMLLVLAMSLRCKTSPLSAAPLTVVYDGAASPIIACSPLRACVVRLCGNETVFDTVAGDTNHWQIVRGASGSNGSLPTYYLKPSDIELPQTNLIITTNRRIYELELVAVANTPHTIYTFTCSGVQPAPRAVASSEGVSDPSTLPSPASFDFAYRIDGLAAFSPDIVCNDGTHTWIHLPRGMVASPAIYATDADGGEIYTPVHVDPRDPRWLRIDSVPARFVLTSFDQSKPIQVVVERM